MRTAALPSSPYLPSLYSPECVEGAFAEVRLPRAYFSEVGELSSRGVEGRFYRSNWPIRESVKSIIYKGRTTSIQSPHNTPDERGNLMFASLTAKVVTAVCVLVGAIALLGTILLTLTGGSPYLQFGLALIFFAMFLVGSYWWMVFGPGRGL
jgi:hypothetical protein